MGSPDTVQLSKNEEVYSPAIAGAIANAEAWIKAACAMAVRFPRDMDVVRQKILRECERPSFAAVALYAKPIGGGKVTGFSIRFAEAAIQAMGHMHVTTQTLAETDEFRKIECRVWDAQNMNSYADEATIQKTIERKSVQQGQEVLRTRVGSQGQLLYIIRAEEGDLLNTVNAAKSKSIRTSGLRHIPGWLLDECKLAVNETMRKRDSTDPEKAKRELFDAFGDIGVSVEQLKKYLGHENPTLQPAELQDLRKLYTAIKTGETTIQAIFAVREEAEKNSKAASVRDKILGNKAGATITKEQAKALDNKAADTGWKPMEWGEALRKKFDVAVTDKIPAAMFDEAMKLASGS